MDAPAMTSQVLPLVTEHLLVPVLTAIAAALVGLIGYIATAAKRALEAIATRAQADTHARDVALLTATMQRKAIAAVADTATPPPIPAEIVAYVERVRGDLLTKMQPTPEALETMAQAAIATAEAATVPPVVIAPPDVLLPPGR